MDYCNMCMCELCRKQLSPIPSIDGPMNDTLLFIDLILFVTGTELQAGKLRQTVRHF